MYLKLCSGSFSCNLNKFNAFLRVANPNIGGIINLKFGGLVTERKRGNPEEHCDEGKTGGVAERLNAAVLKTVVLQGTEGSNPSASVLASINGG